MARAEPARWRVVDAGGSADDLAARVLRAVEEALV
jgi:hypothetical protein